jgi:cephalosporin-C deacetylase-like acetyl esterase
VREFIKREVTGVTTALEGTRPFGPEELDANYAFSDHYAKQWMDTMAWMQRSLQERTAYRNRHRRADKVWLSELRRTLFRISGAEKFIAEPVHAELRPSSQTRAMYRIELANGISCAGLAAFPAEAPLRGLVVFANSEGGQLKEQTEISAYVEHGFAVIQPFLCQATCNFQDHPQRKWYIHPDHVTMHNSAFIIGGSLAGMEAAELTATTGAILAALNLDPGRVPVIVDMRGRHHLSGMVAAALYPDWASVIRLDERADLLNHQEHDDVTNTLWSFHQYLDLLSMLQLAENAHIVFADPAPTPSPWAAQAIVWFERFAGERARRCMIRHPREVMDTILKLIEPASRLELSFAGFRSEGQGDQQLDGMALYKRALNDKADFLEREHAAARNRKAQRYDLDSLSIEEYKARIEQAVLAVMGPPLPLADDPNVRTNLVNTPSEAPYHLYQILMQTVEGIDAAGYLLLPKQEGEHPAVICQHGLMGRPEALIGMDGHYIYYRMAAVLAEKGYVVFVPFMNWGWGGASARNAACKKAYALGITYNRFEAAQLHAIVKFLQSRPEVDARRIGFYGLSYGGHASLWLGACEPELAVVVTAGHFNDWHKKLMSTEIHPPYSYTRSYITVDNCLDMFTFDVLNQLGHAELAALQAPRPYMVENGLRDPVSPKLWVEAEFAKVREVYARLGASDQAALCHFDGEHRFWGEESLIFLHKHLQRK